MALKGVSMNKKIEDKNYNAEAIQVVEGLAHVRQRPGMYIGGTGSRGLHHLVWEIVDNSIDEATNGYADEINVLMNEDGSITVTDNGRGIPVDLHPQKKIPAVRLVFEVIGAGGKFNNNSYKTSGGLHGVGASVVNALSKWVNIRISRDGNIYELRYERAKLIKEIAVVGKDNKTGTTVTFFPDDTIFETIEFKYDTLKNRLRELAFLNKGICINLIDKHKNRKETFKYDGGLKQFVEFINESKDVVNNNVIYISGEKDNIVVEAALQYTKGYSENIYSFVNNISTTEGGTHDAGFRGALTRAFNEFIKIQNSQKQRRKKEVSLQGSDTTEGLTAVLSVKMTNTQFEGQTKTKLGNPEAKGAVFNIIYEGLLDFLQKNKKASKDIMDKILNAFDSREAAKAARDIARKKSTLNATSVLTVGKLANCSSKNPEEKELFIVEGDSAGGSAKQGRNRRTQAVLPLKGKPLNVEKKSIKAILENEEMRSLIKSIGGGIGNDFRIEEINYHKIIIATDADVDGAHIRLILLTFFYRYMRPLIEEGYIYIAQPPLYKVFNNNKIEYAYTDKDLEKAKQKIGKTYTIQRYKGLGEMNPEQLWETTMDPNNRTLVRVSLDDAATADTLFSIFMGSKVEPRKVYLQENM